MALNPTVPRDGRGLAEALIGDGRPVLTVTGLALAGCGGFALFQSATGHFLPHDVEFLGMDARALCALQQCRIVHFMFHDRVAFGGVLIAVGLLYAWLAEFPLRAGEAWAWRARGQRRLRLRRSLTYIGTATSTPGTARPRSCCWRSSPSAWADRGGSCPRRQGRRRGDLAGPRPRPGHPAGDGLGFVGAGLDHQRFVGSTLVFVPRI